MLVHAAIPNQDRSRNLVRWIAVLGFSALLHLLMFGVISAKLRFPDWNTPQAQEEKSVRVKMVAPPEPPVARLEPTKLPKPPAAKKPPRPRVAKAESPPLQPQPYTEPASPPEPPPASQPLAEPTPVAQSPLPASTTDKLTTAPAGQGSAGATGSTSGQGTASQPAGAEAQPDTPPAPVAASYEVVAPPSVILKYKVQALRDGQVVYGNGKITFQTDGKQYSVDGEAGVLFFTVLNFRSTGEVGQHGIAPVLYSEKRFRKSATATHFQREANLISFSASTNSYLRAGGEQDRASLVWQLAGIGRGNASLFKPDATFDFFVAGVRDGETWQLRVLGQEEIESGDGMTSAWHVVRIPRPGSYEQQLDIWLAPGQQWIPVKLRFTEKNGEYLDMALSSATPVEQGTPTPVANAPAATEMR